MYRLRNLRILLSLSRRGLHLDASSLSIRPPNLRQLTVSSSASARVFFPDDKPSLLHLGFHRFFLFPSMQRLPLPSLFSPGSGAPSPSFPPPPPTWRSFPQRRRPETAELGPPLPRPAQPRGGVPSPGVRSTSPLPPRCTCSLLSPSLFHG
jgi:hypothetical protein